MKEWKIKSYGAAADGVANDAPFIQKVIDACSADGGGRVLFEPGTYNCSSIYLRSNVELYLMRDAKIQGSSNPDDYHELVVPGFASKDAGEGSSKSLITASNESNIAIRGPGEINGNGPSFYDISSVLWSRFYAKPPIPRPRMVTCYRCRNVSFEETSFVDSPCWTFWMIDSEDISFDRVRIYGDRKMINQDGIDIDACRNTEITGCYINTGDDCIAVRAMPVFKESSPVCEKLTVTDCELSSACNAVRIGCPNDRIIRECSFSNITIRNSCNGIISVHPVRYMPAGVTEGQADISGIKFSGVDIECFGNPFLFTVDEPLSVKRISDFVFEDFKVRCDKPARLGYAKLKNIQFRNFEVISPLKEFISAVPGADFRACGIDLHTASGQGASEC